MDFTGMSDREILLEIIRKRQWCELATVELARRAIEEPENDDASPGDRIPR